MKLAVMHCEVIMGCIEYVYGCYVIHRTSGVIFTFRGFDDKCMNVTSRDAGVVYVVLHF